MVNKMMAFFMTMRNSEKGQGMVEYALIIALVAVLLIAAIGLMRGQIEQVFTSITTALSGAS